MIMTEKMTDKNKKSRLYIPRMECIFLKRVGDKALLLTGRTLVISAISCSLLLRKLYVTLGRKKKRKEDKNEQV